MKPGDRRGRPPRYTVERLLGRGGMASVYLAHDDELDRTVALKVPAAELAEDDTFRARFLREARVTSRLVHPNIVRVYDAGEDDEGLFIALEHVDGETLAEELQRRGRLPAAEVARLGTEVAAALDAAHAAGLVHRDVKPQNIMRTKSGEAKLGDFGIARAPGSTVVTEHGTVLGTAAYLAPEQARGERVTAAADIYALGVVLYEALTGRLPHEGASLPELLLKRERDAPTPVEAHDPSVPPALQVAITQSLAHAPEDRPASAAAFARQLALALPGPATRVTRSHGAEATRVLAPREAQTALTRLMPARPFRGRALAIPVVVLLAVPAIGAGIWSRGGESPPPPVTAHPEPPPPVRQPPRPPSPVALPPPTPAVDCGKGERGQGKGKGKARGHDRQAERCADEGKDEDD